MKYLSSLILIILLANIVALSAQAPQDNCLFEDKQNRFSHIAQAEKSIAKTNDEENLLIAIKTDLVKNGTWTFRDSTNYYYNEQNLLVLKDPVMDSNSEINGGYRLLYEYDSQRNEIYHEVQEWNWNENTWDEYTRYLRTYDADNNLLEFKQEYFYDEVWNLRFRHTCEYDSNNNIISCKYQEGEGLLHDNVQIIYEYDSIGNLTLELRQEWRENEWKEAKRKLFEYDENNNQDQYIWQFKYPYFSNWQDQYKYVNDYDSNNNLILNVEYSWYGDHWGNNIRTEYEYDENGNLILENFDDMYHYRYFYDLHNNLISRVIFYLIDGHWRPMFQYLFEYDNENKVLVEYYQSWRDDMWFDRSRKTYYYLNEKEPLKSDLTLDLFPNPSDGQFTINLEKHGIINGLLEIFNSNGQLVHFQKIDLGVYQINVNLEGLSNGTYYLELSDDNTKIKQTLMLVR